MERTEVQLLTPPVTPDDLTPTVSPVSQNVSPDVTCSELNWTFSESESSDEDDDTDPTWSPSGSGKGMVKYSLYFF